MMNEAVEGLINYLHEEMDNWYESEYSHDTACLYLDVVNAVGEKLDEVRSSLLEVKEAMKM